MIPRTERAAQQAQAHSFQPIFASATRTAAAAFRFWQVFLSCRFATLFQTRLRLFQESPPERNPSVLRFERTAPQPRSMLHPKNGRSFDAIVFHGSNHRAQ